ncbi:MAG: hypothetical protein OXG97_21770 [Candidatus Poribacteria bacterium]|nr:hypothetical protein [Candidatus Poribacteria bacterium]
MNPTDSSQQNHIREKILRFNYLWIYVYRNKPNSTMFHQAIYKDIQSGNGKFVETCLTPIKSEEVFTLEFKFIREILDGMTQEMGEGSRNYSYYTEDSNKGKSFREIIDETANNANMDNKRKKEYKDFMKKCGFPGSSDEPEGVAKSADLAFLSKIGMINTIEDLEKFSEWQPVKYELIMPTIDPRLLFNEWLICYQIVGEAVRMKGFDKSYINDLMYCYYLPFCDIFVTAEKTFPSVLKPLCDRFDFVNFMTFDNFKNILPEI